jgi:hypothetical protein
MYSLTVIGLFWATFNTAGTLDGLWRRIADVFIPLGGITGRVAGPPPGFTPPPLPSQDEILRFQLLGAVPAIVAGLALWLGTWIPLGRGLVSGPDVEIERRSVLRKLAIYLVVIVSAVVVLISATFALSTIGRRLLGDPVVEPYTSMWHELGSSIPYAIVFGAVWLFHRRVVEGEAARETESARAAAIRRLYVYLISAIGLAMAAVGIAGAVGVFGSQLMGINTHSHEETARYVAFVLVGGAAWAFHWRTARARLDDEERRSAQRRLYLYAAVLGGVLGLLVFGSAALYRLLNAALALSFTLETWHDVWHFTVDSTVAGAIALWSFRAIRADRAALGAAGDETYAVTVLVRAADRESARARVTSALAGDPDLSVKG